MMGEIYEGAGGGGVRRACRGKKQEVVWGQRWLPVCLWNTSQVALTVNAGKTKFPKLGCEGRWVGGWGGGESWSEEGGACKGGEITAEMACMWMMGLTVGLATGGGGVGGGSFTESLGPE